MPLSAVLPVVRVLAVFPQIMLVHHELIRARNVRVDLLGDECHFGDFFDDGGVVDGGVGVFPEGEHAVALDEHAGHFQRLDVILLKALDDDQTRFGVLGQKGFDLPLQPLPDGLTSGLKVEPVGNDLLGQAEQTVLDAGICILQTKI